jgi:hypothetical protein
LQNRRRDRQECGERGSLIRSFRLDAGRLHDRQEARFLSTAEGLDLGRRDRPGSGAKIVYRAADLP